MVAADAGCGKTTLIADFIRNQTRPAVWYQLDHTDADPIVFLGYIAQGIKNFAPDFGETIFPYLSEANEDLVRYPERAVDLLLNEILQTTSSRLSSSSTITSHRPRNYVHQWSPACSIFVRHAAPDHHHPRSAAARDYAPPLAIGRACDHPEDLLFTDDEVRDLFRRPERGAKRQRSRIPQPDARLDHGPAARPPGGRAEIPAIRKAARSI